MLKLRDTYRRENMLSLRNEDLKKSLKPFIKPVECDADQTVESLPSQEYKTESKVALLWLANTVLLQLTVGNPLLPSYIRYPLGVLSLLPTAKTFYSNVKLHIANTVENATPEKRIKCIFVATMVTCFDLLALIGAAYSLQNKKERVDVVISLALWLTFANACINLLSTSSFFDKKHVSKESLADELKNETEALIKEIDFLKSNIQKIDSFVISRKDLLELVKDYAEKFPEYICNDIDFSTDDLNMDDDIDKMTIYKIKRLECEHMLNERIEFIKRHKEVYDSFYKHVKEMHES